MVPKLAHSHSHSHSGTPPLGKLEAAPTPELLRAHNRATGAHGEPEGPRPHLITVSNLSVESQGCQLLSKDCVNEATVSD